jgi:hypothetical protein
MPVIPATARSVNRRILVQAGHGHQRNFVSKTTKAKRARDMDQVIECLSSKLEGLSSNPNTTKGVESVKKIASSPKLLDWLSQGCT